jgi:hypothetical protein
MSGPTELIRQNCPIATSGNDGIMSAAQAAAVAAGAAVTLQGAYDNGAGTPQTITEDAVRQGIKIVGSGQAGSIFAVQTSAAASALQVDEDGSVYLARVAGVKVQNTVAFGSPIISSATTDGYMSLTSDGVGASWGGTGITAKQSAGTPANSAITMSLNDVSQFSLKEAGFLFTVPELGESAPTVAISANAIALTKRVTFVGAGLLKTITFPSAFSGWWYVLPTAAFTWDITGNMAVAGTAVIGQMITLWRDAVTGKVYPSYV